MRVGVTGITSDLGKALLPRLDADASVERIITFDVAAPTDASRKVEYVRADLTRPDLEAELLRTFRDARLDVLYHLAFVNSRVHGAAFSTRTRSHRHHARTGRCAGLFTAATHRALVDGRLRRPT